MGFWKNFIKSMDLNAEEGKEERERIKKEQSKGYCVDCKTKFKITREDNVGANIGANAIGIGLAILTGFGFFTHSKLNPCPYCGGKIKRGVFNEKEKNKNIKYIAQHKEEIENKEDKEFIKFIKIAGGIIIFFIIFGIIKWIITGSI